MILISWHSLCTLIKNSKGHIDDMQPFANIGTFSWQFYLNFMILFQGRIWRNVLRRACNLISNLSLILCWIPHVSPEVLDRFYFLFIAFILSWTFHDRGRSFHIIESSWLASLETFNLSLVYRSKFISSMSSSVSVSVCDKSLMFSSSTKCQG